MTQSDRKVLRHWRTLLVGLLALVSVWCASGARAQTPTWQEQRTTHFSVLYPQGSEAVAQQYAQFVDGVYEEVSAIFSYRTPPPVVLRIYPTMELYYGANPLARNLPGVVAHAHTGRREISIALPQTAQQGPDQIVNNVRHELTHIIAADLSDNKLNTAFQEGIAQYIEHPSQELDIKMQIMQQAIGQNRLLGWSEINQPGVAYADPQIGYPETYTIVAFLINRNGFATFKTFLDAWKTSTGYRGALETAYGASADQLETEWRAQLPAFVGGAYRNRQVTAFDLTGAQAQVASGDYAAAVTQLEQAIATLEKSNLPDQVQQARELLSQAQNGLHATQRATDARNALQKGDYRAAQDAAEEARVLLRAMNQPAQQRVVEEYARLATEGLTAQQELTKANADIQVFHINAARERLNTAYVTFTKLGDENGAARAQTALLTIQRTETGAAIGLVVVASLLLGWNMHRRAHDRQRAIPFA